MRFLIKEKVFIIALYFLDVNLNRISKIINAFRQGTPIEDILIDFGSNQKLCACLKSFKLPFDPNRNKCTSRNAVEGVVKKWLSSSTIDNFKRQNYHQAISEQRVKHLCNFVSTNNQTRKLKLFQLKTLLNLPCGLSTICNYLKENDLKCFVQRKKLLLNTDHKIKRLAFALTYIHFPADFWMSVIFTDEKGVQNYNNGRVFIRRPKKTSRSTEFATICDKSGRFRINLWGYVCSKGFAIFKVGNMDELEYLKVIKNRALPNFEAMFPDRHYRMLQDNCKAHKTGLVLGYLESKKVTLVPFPPRSPDLNIIEHFWSLLQKNVNK